MIRGDHFRGATAIKDRYSVLYNNEVLFLAITKRDKISFLNTNQVIAFKNEFNGETSGAEKKFMFEGESEIFGKMEDIRAVNFQKREQELYAYVVTFEKTDPLFVINISNPKQIKILSELKVPGFSTQLSSLKESLLLGIGYDAKADYGFSWFGGIKLSLFDIGELAKPLELDYKIFGSRGSFSEVTANPKAIMRSKDLSALAFPLVVYTKSESQDPWVFGGQLEFAGVTIINVTQQNTFLEKGRLSHSNWRIKYCGEDFSGAGMGGWWFGNNTSGDIQRIIEEQDRYITFSRFGVKAYQTQNLDLIMEVEFPNNDSSQCLGFNGTPRSQW